MENATQTFHWYSNIFHLVQSQKITEEFRSYNRQQMERSNLCFVAEKKTFRYVGLG